MVPAADVVVVVLVVLDHLASLPPPSDPCPGSEPNRAKGRRKKQERTIKGNKGQDKEQGNGIEREAIKEERRGPGQGLVREWVFWFVRLMERKEGRQKQEEEEGRRI